MECGEGCASPSRDISVRHDLPWWRPITTRGITRTLSCRESSAKAKVPMHTRPEPGSLTGSSTRAWETRVRHAAEASLKRSGPRNESVSAVPRPTSPCPRRCMVSGFSALTQSVNEPSWLIALVVATRVGTVIELDTPSRLARRPGRTLCVTFVRILAGVLD